MEMPIYQYVCEKCDKKHEEIQKFEDPPPNECPYCQAKNTLSRVAGVSNFQLKGSGWAKDGY